MIWLTFKTSTSSRPSTRVNITDPNQKCAFSFFLWTGDPVSAGERSSAEHPRRHCTVSLQRRGAQQNSHRGLLRRTVSSEFSICFPSAFLFSFLISLLNLLCMLSDMGTKPQEIGSLDLLSYLFMLVKYLSRRVVLIDKKSMGISLWNDRDLMLTDSYGDFLSEAGAVTWQQDLTSKINWVQFLFGEKRVKS